MAFPLAAIGAGIGQFAEQYRQQQESALWMLQAQRQMQAFEEEQRQLRQQREAQGAAFRVASQGGFGAPQPIQGLPQVGGGSQGWPSGGAPAGGGGMRAGGALTNKYDPNDPVEFIPQFESGNRNIMQGVVGPQGGYNPSVGRVTGPSSAGGYWQITNPTWMEFAPKAGVDVAQYPTAISAPREVQKAVANAIYRETGFSRWEPYNKRFSAALRGLNLGGDAGTATDLAAGSGQFAMPTDMAAGLGAPRPTGPPDTLVAGGGARPTPDAPTPEGPLSPPGVGLITPADYSRATGQPLTVPPATPTDYSTPPPAVASPLGAATPRPGTATAAPAADPMAQVQQQVVQGVQQTARITPPSVYGRMGIQGLVQQIEKAMPGADDATKFLALQHAQKLLAPDAQIQLELYKEQRQHDWQVEFAKFQSNLRVGERKPDIMTDPATNQQYLFYGPGKATTLSGEPYTPGGAQKLGAGGAGGGSAAGEQNAAIVAEAKRRTVAWAAENPDATPDELAEVLFQNRLTVQKEYGVSKRAPATGMGARRADILALDAETKLNEWVQQNPDASEQQKNAKKVEFWNAAEKAQIKARTPQSATFHNIEIRDPETNQVLVRESARPDADAGAWVTADGRVLPQGKVLRIGDTKPRSEAEASRQQFFDDNPWARGTDYDYYRANRILNDSVMRAMGGGIMGRNIIALNTVADHILRVQQYAEDLGNGQLPRANQVAVQVAREMGRPEPTTYEAARDIMADEVVRLLTATGGTRGDRAGMQGNFPSMLAPEQFAGVFTMLKHMVGGRLEGLRTQFARGDPVREQQFDTQLLSPKGREAFLSLTSERAATLPETSAPGAVPPSSGGAPVPTAPPPRQQRSGAGPPYKAGDIIVKGGRQYRVIGGDPNDPDVEPVQ